MAGGKIAIIGGGPGGLMTAHALQKQATTPHEITIFEASDRLGGKIVSGQFTTTPARYEAGAAEFYDYSAIDEDPLKELIAELGLGISPMSGSSLLMNNRILATLEDVQAHLGPKAGAQWQTFDRIARDRISPGEFYRSGDADISRPAHLSHRFDSMLNAAAFPEADVLVRAMIHSDLATEPALTTVEYGLHNYLMNDPAYMSLYAIIGGNEQLPRELAARIRARMLTRHRVTAIARAANGKHRVRWTRDGQPGEEEFDWIVVALPVNHLPGVVFEGELLALAMRGHHSNYDHPAHYLRITGLFKEPFWRKKLPEAFCMLDAFDGCCLYDESSRHPGCDDAILGWLLGGEAARDLSHRSDDDLIELALASLPDFLAAGRELFVEARVHRWVGAVNALPGGTVSASLERRHQPEPLEHPRLFVVGDYLFDSTLNGVLESAEFVAGWLASQMAEADGVFR